MLALELIKAKPSPTPTPVPEKASAVQAAVPDLYVHGQVLTVARGFFVFTNGDAVRVRAATVVPPGTITGSYVRVTIDQLTREIKLIELEPRTLYSGEIDAGQLGRQYVVSTPGSRNTGAPGGVELSSNSGKIVSITLNVAVPPTTPSNDDVYLSTDRSGFGPAEIRMQRLDARHFSVTIGVASGTTLRYIYTRGFVNTVERSSSGGIAAPRELVVSDGAKTLDTVARWADIL